MNKRGYPEKKCELMDIRKKTRRIKPLPKEDG
jgi:hypothetical protein